MTTDSSTLHPPYPPPSHPSGPDRIISVDVLRALDILLMVFVNDLEHTPGAPSWLQHIQPPNADGMTVADVVFPGFLFIAGMSIPLAFERALARGTTKGALLLHVLGRTLSLLILGVLIVNETPQLEGWSKPLWETLLYAAMILTWSSPVGSSSFVTLLKWFLRLVGAGTLAYLAWVFRSPDGNWLQTQWWGILGLIGWAYLVASLVYLAIGRHRELLVGAGVLLMTVYLSRSHAGGVLGRLDSKPWPWRWLALVRPALDAAGGALNWVDSYVSLRETLGSLAATTVFGTVLGSILLPGFPTHSSTVIAHGPQASSLKPQASAEGRLRWAAIYGAGLAAGAFLLDTFHGINKIGGTPSWCLWSSAIICWTWMLLYWLIDCRSLAARQPEAAGFPPSSSPRPQALSPGLRPLVLTGSNPLLPYFLHPLLLGLLPLLGVTFHTQMSESSPTMGLLRSTGMVLVVMLLTAGLTRLGLRLKL